MKRNGEKVTLAATATAVIPRIGGEDLDFEIRAIPLGFSDKLDAEFPTPRAPVITTGSGGKVTKEKDLEDPNYLEALDLCRRRKNALIVHYALTGTKKVTFDAKDGGNSEAFADALIAEFKESGLSDGDFAILLDQIDALSNNTLEQVGQARSLFLSPAPQ